jgi:hypothetical protein
VRRTYVFCDICRGRFEIALASAVIDLYQGAPCKVPQIRKNAMLQTVFATGAGNLARAEPRLVAHLNARPLTAAAASYVRCTHHLPQPRRFYLE